MEAENIAPMPQGASASQRWMVKNAQLFCVISIIVLLITLFILAIVVLVAFKYAESPQFHVKNIQVSAFRVTRLKPPVLTANINVIFHSNNQNKLVGVNFWKVVLETCWFEVGGDLIKGSHEVQHFTQGSKSVSKLMMNAKGEVQISKSSLKKEDMKLDLILKGELNYYYGVLGSEKRRFLVLCNGVSIVSYNITCKTEVFSSKSRQGQKYEKLFGG